MAGFYAPWVAGQCHTCENAGYSGLVDEWKLLVQPHIMGTGAGSLFAGIHTSLDLIQVQQLEKGILQLCYGRGC